VGDGPPDPCDQRRMVLSAMDRHLKEAIDNQVDEECRKEPEATSGLAHARAALERIGSFESSALIRAERDGHSPERHSEHGR
jgi:hypothetical protein